MIDALRGIVGAANCLTDSKAIEPYLTEIRGLFRGAAAAVVLPGSTEDVSRVVAHCAAKGLPMVPMV